jgi:hypothetical protein
MPKSVSMTAKHILGRHPDFPSDHLMETLLGDLARELEVSLLREIPLFVRSIIEPSTDEVSADQ